MIAVDFVWLRRNGIRSCTLRIFASRRVAYLQHVPRCVNDENCSNLIVSFAVTVTVTIANDLRKTRHNNVDHVCTLAIAIIIYWLDVYSNAL